MENNFLILFMKGVPKLKLSTENHLNGNVLMTKELHVLLYTGKDQFNPTKKNYKISRIGTVKAFSASIRFLRPLIKRG